MVRFASHLVVIVSALVFSTPAAAAPITTLFNTGVDASGALLVGGNGTVDTHWDIVSGPGITVPIDAVTYFNTAYFSDGPNSRWLSASLSGGFDAGAYLFQTMFDLTGFNPAATSISVSCATDDRLDGVLLNGVAVAGDCDGYGVFQNFTISSGFAPTTNTLQFNVVDTGFPMGFRAQFTSNATPINGAAIPEPASLLLVGSGVAGMVAKARRRMRQQA